MVTGDTMATMSTSCEPIWRTPLSIFRSGRLACPEMKTQGVESRKAAVTPVMALVLPGPEVTSPTPGAFVYWP